MRPQHHSSHLTIKRYEAQEWSLVKGLHERSYQGDLERRMKAFRWITEHNPFGHNINCIMLFKDGELIGYSGMMPMRFYFDGEPFTAIFTQETLINPLFRGQGFTAAFVKEERDLNSFLVSFWHNEKIVNMRLKAGWMNIGYFRPLKKIFKIDNLFRLKVRKWSTNKVVEDILLALARRYYRLRKAENYKREQYDVETIGRFDSEYDEFFLNVVKKFRVIFDRSSQTLNWKYIDIPHRRFHALCARKNHRIVGYIILAIEEQEYNIKKGIIADLLIDPDEVDALICLSGMSEQFFVEKGVDFSICLVPLPISRSVMMGQGYFQAKQMECDSLLIYNEKVSPNPGIVKDINNWYFTYGDSDFMMW